MASPLATLKGNMQKAPTGGAPSSPRSGRPQNPLEGELGRSLLDQATERLTRGLEGAAYQAQAAAMLQGGRDSSFPNAVGRGLDARLQTQLFMRTKPYELAREQATGQYVTAQARQQELQNKIDELNLGYMTAPWDVSGVSTPGGGQPTGGAPAGGGGNLGGSLAQQVNPDALPLTPESQQRMSFLEAQLNRAKQFANTAPQARQDLMAIVQQMSEVVQNDPLAKQAIANQTTKFNTEQQLGSAIKQKILDIGKESMDAAQAELQSLSNAPNFTVDLSDPNKINRWIDQRAKSIFAERYGMLKQQLGAMNIDPDRYAAEITQAQAEAQTPATGQAPAAVPPATPAGLAPASPQLPPADFTARPLAAPGSGPAPASTGAVVSPHAPMLAPVTPPPAPTQVPQVPATPSVQTAATPPILPGEDPNNPFVQRPPTTGERLDLNKEQAVSGATLQQLGSIYGDLQDALKLNEHALAGGLLGTTELAARREAVALQDRLMGGSHSDPVLTATATLQAVLSNQTLQNLSSLIKGNPTEGERAYVERLGATLQMTRGERGPLIQRAIRLIRPRLEFEKMRSDALAHGTFIDPNSYEDWLKQSYGPSVGARIAAGDPPPE